MGVIYLPFKGRKRFQEELPWFGESNRTPSGYRVTEFQHKLAYTGKSKLCLLYGRFKPRSSSGTAVTPVELIDLSLKPVRASRVLGVQGPYGGYQLVLTLYRIYFVLFSNM